MLEFCPEPIDGNKYIIYVEHHGYLYSWKFPANIDNNIIRDQIDYTFDIKNDQGYRIRVLCRISIDDNKYIIYVSTTQTIRLEILGKY